MWKMLNVVSQKLSFISDAPDSWPKKGKVSENACYVFVGLNRRTWSRAYVFTIDYLLEQVQLLVFSK